MKWSFRTPARGALGVLLSVLPCVAACTPNHDVKPGAPELIEFNIVEGGGAPTPTGTIATTIRPDTPDCATTIASGDACLPQGMMADAVDGGTNDANTPPDTVCHQVSAMNWCRCMGGDPTMPNAGVWNCDPFKDVISVVAVFDRLLDTAPLDPGDAAALTDLVMVSDSSSAAVGVVTDYSPTGDPNGVIFNVFGPLFFANYRADGPSLLSLPQDPEFPSGATLTATLNSAKVRAKDGTTPFLSNGTLMGGSVTFTTAPFGASVATPDFTMMDPVDPAAAATVVFTNFVDTATAPDHITAATPAGPVAIMAMSGDNGATFTVTPASGAWPKGETVTITVDATIKNLLGQTTTGAATGTLTAP
jgi:hypothetical protein